MSCMIQKKENTFFLATLIQMLMDMPNAYSYFGFTAPQSVFSAFEDCRAEKSSYGHFKDKIYHKLRKLNLECYEDRYEHNADALASMPTTSKDFMAEEVIEQICVDSEHPAPVKSGENNNLKIEDRHFRWLKILEFYMYQIDEAPFNGQLYDALEDLHRTMMDFIVHNTPSYINEAWG